MSHEQIRVVSAKINLEDKLDTNLKNPVLSGLLLKRNKYYVKQQRRFELFMDGTINYYKNLELRGSLFLIPGTKAIKIGRNECTLRIPGARKDYQLLGKDPEKYPLKNRLFSCNIDDWVSAINSVVQILERGEKHKLK